MLTVIQEVIEPQTKIVFCEMSDKSILLRVNGPINYFLSKSELDKEILRDILPRFSKEQVIGAFERLELPVSKKSNVIVTALDGFF